MIVVFIFFPVRSKPSMYGTTPASKGSRSSGAADSRSGGSRENTGGGRRRTTRRSSRRARPAPEAAAATNFVLERKVYEWVEHLPVMG